MSTLSTDQKQIWRCKSAGKHHVTICIKSSRVGEEEDKQSFYKGIVRGRQLCNFSTQNAFLTLQLIFMKCK